MLEQVGIYNDLSPKLREELQKRIEGKGKFFRYRFKLEKANPDPTHYNGPLVWPFLYTLDPITYRITDHLEDRKEKQKVKNIGIVLSTDDKGKPTAFKRVRLKEGQQGIIDYNTENIDDLDFIAFLEMHPKMDGGLFQDKTLVPVFFRVDAVKDAVEKSKVRSAKVLALTAAQGMSDADLKKFADSMGWDSTQEPAVLKALAEELAEETPEFFNQMVEEKTVEYKATVKQALDKKVIEFDPTEYKIIWSGNKQTIKVLSPNGEKSHVDKMAEWLMTGGTKEDEVYKKIKSLIK